ncbi:MULTISPECIES: hypothetical protein [Prochlorococcus]|uniref:hypothetical protein n=1 Tax=Prochlorococcus TaxID=1218 RepID=UPI00055A92D6|nr:MULTISPECIES: hypothetical protein [Prochlorococcus]
MSYEAGSRECRMIVEAKDNLLKVMTSLENLESSNHLNLKLKAIYEELEIIHEKRKDLESKKNPL